VISQTFGNFKERSDKCEYLTLAFSPLSVPLRSRWRNNGLSADFLGDYVTTFLPANAVGAPDNTRQAEIKYSVTYIANELLENSMKYHEREVDIPIGIHLELASDNITVSASNGVGIEQADRYKAFLEHLLAGDPGDLMLAQQEESAVRSNSAMSGMGLLTMMSDHGVRLSWRFEIDPLQSQFMTVTTFALLPLGGVPGASK
jgi:hypothetical protein